jgi:hypothetical protein
MAKHQPLDPDAPAPPPGLRPRPGVEYGCGDPDCSQCYEPANSDENWANDDIQFARLLTEIADLCLGPGDYVELATSMDLTVPEVHQLFERAQVKWDAIKARTR